MKTKLKQALEEIIDCADNNIAAASLPMPPEIHREGLTAGMEKIKRLASDAIRENEEKE